MNAKIKENIPVVIKEMNKEEAIGLGAMALFGEKYEIPGVKKSISVDEKTLKKYTGEYELEKGFTILITVEGGNLVLQATGQPKFSMLAETEKDFFLINYPISITFETDKIDLVNST